MLGVKPNKLLDYTRVSWIESSTCNKFCTWLSKCAYLTFILHSDKQAEFNIRYGVNECFPSIQTDNPLVSNFGYILITDSLKESIKCWGFLKNVSILGFIFAKKGIGSVTYTEYDVIRES